MRLLAALLIFAGLLLGMACGGGAESAPDFTAQRDALPVYPGATLAKEGVGPFGESGNVYKYDRLYGATVNLSVDVILTSMTTQLQQAGWQQEDAVTSRDNTLLEYCQIGAPITKCASFVNGGVRVLVTVVVPFNFGGQALPTYYHTHLEKQ